MTVDPLVFKIIEASIIKAKRLTMCSMTRLWQDYCKTSRMNLFSRCKFLIIPCVIILLSAQAYASEFDQDLYWFKNILHFSRLSQKQVLQYLNPLMGPSEFRLDKESAPWAGNYFPMEKGGIAHRWKKEEFPELLLNQEDILSLSKKNLNLLSPVEKFDILMGYYDFRTTQHELNQRGPLRNTPPEDWEGFCNGVRCAGLLTKEPQHSVTITNPEGIQITFSIADLKALAGASYFYVEKYGQLGGPTQNGSAANQPNAAVFDLALRYYLANHKQGFVIDSHLGAEIWNETVVGYKRSLSPVRNLSFQERELYPAAVKKVRIDLVLETLGEVEIKHSNRSTKKHVANGSMLETLETAYTLYLDIRGNAIDGRWHNKANQTRGVDFAWFASGKGADHNYAHQGGNPFLKFKEIEKLIRLSTSPTCSSIF